jgi:pheromone shutdown protein TraB
MSDNNAARKGDEIIHSSIFADITSIVAEGAAYAVIGAAVGAAATVAAPLLGAGRPQRAWRRLDPAVC